MSYKNNIYAKYAAGELSEEERLKLEQSGDLADLDKILQATGELNLPAYDLDKAYAQLRRQNNQVVKPSVVRRLAIPLSVAASLFLLVAAFIIFKNLKTTISADHSGNIAYAFQDGSSVDINNGSSIIYNEKNWDETRTVQLNGEAYFEVEKGKPFTVQTNFGEIQVLGTSFNVRTHDEHLVVQCFSGKVQVVNQNGKQKTLTANKEVKLINQKFEAVKSVEESQPLWQNGVSEFENAKATWVFKELERQHNLKVVGAIPNENFTGRFVHDTLENAISQICEPLNLDCLFNKEKNEVKIK